MHSAFGWLCQVAKIRCRALQAFLFLTAPSLQFRRSRCPVIAMKSTSRLIPSADSAVISIGKSHRLPGSSNVTRALAGYRDNFANVSLPRTTKVAAKLVTVSGANVRLRRLATDREGEGIRSPLFKITRRTISDQSRYSRQQFSGRFV
jgi:hypothetical protein